MKEIIKITSLFVFMCIQIAWIPIGIFGFICIVVGKFIEDTHMQLCDLIDYIVFKLDLKT